MRFPIVPLLVALSVAGCGGSAQQTGKVEIAIETAGALFSIDHFTLGPVRELFDLENPPFDLPPSVTTYRELPVGHYGSLVEAWDTFGSDMGHAAVAEIAFDVLPAETTRTSVTLPGLPTGARFAKAATYPTGVRPSAVAAGDFDRDGALDLAVADDSSRDGAVSILRGRGDGTFRKEVAYSVDGAYRLAVSDFNGDGSLDIAAASSRRTLLLGGDNGTFDPVSPVEALGQGALGVADFNGDRHPDLFKGGSVWLGRGDGTFVGPKSGFGADEGTAADFDGDGHLDLVLAGGTLLAGNGDGTFRYGWARIAAVSPSSRFAAADLDGDGRADLAVLDGKISVHIGRGDGSFRSPAIYDVLDQPIAMTLADVDADGKPDLLVASYAYNCVSVRMNLGDGTFASAESYGAGPGPNAIAVGDFDGDKHLDLAVSDGHGTGVSILLQRR